MTTEEKVKVYLEDLKKAKDLLEKISTELKESEDERIRKELYAVINDLVLPDEQRERFNAWLEKQKEQKPANEPKFKVGDWIIFAENHNSVYQVERIDKYRYYLRHYLGGTLSAHFDNESIRQWTIQDAKDGDVLIAKGKYYKEYIFIYSKMTDDDVISTHCGYDVTHNEYDKTLSRFGRVEDFYSVCPATKEQRDLLFTKIKEAGYEWSEETHKLKKIEQKPAEWSKEDEENLNMVLDMVKYCSIVPPEDVPSSTGHLHPSEKYKKELTEWLKSLRPQPYKETYQAAKHDLATEFMNYLDNNKPEGKMCLSNGECEDIDKAFKENDWAKIIRYAKKYQIQSEKKPEVKLTGWVARDEDEKIWVYETCPEKYSEWQQWVGNDGSIRLDQKSFPDLKWKDEPMEVEITIRKK